MSLLEQDTIKKGWVDNLPKPEKKFEVENNKKYKIEAIIDSIMYS